MDKSYRKTYSVAKIENNNVLSELDYDKDEVLIKELIPLFYNIGKNDIDFIPNN